MKTLLAVSFLLISPLALANESKMCFVNVDLVKGDEVQSYATESQFAGLNDCKKGDVISFKAEYGANTLKDRACDFDYTMNTNSCVYLGYLRKHSISKADFKRQWGR